LAVAAGFARNPATLPRVKPAIMNPRLFRTFLLAGSLGFLAGCQTVESRIKEKPEVFASADLATQEKITQGIIDLGFTEDHVYLALGAPDQKRETLNADGRTLTWVYNSYYTRYESDQFVGYHRQVYYDPYIRSYRLRHTPAFVETYRDVKEERIRIVFRNGRASVIEQAKN
jgi:hypothetical protein